MSRDKGDGPTRRPRTLARAQVGWPPALRELKDLLYEAYLAAGAPSLDEITKAIADDNELPGSPSRDTVHRCISGPSLPPKQADAVAVAMVLARGAAWNENAQAARIGQLCVDVHMAVPAGSQSVSLVTSRSWTTSRSTTPSMSAPLATSSVPCPPTYPANTTRRCARRSTPLPPGTAA